ncbi:hypothetical protein Tco_0537413 [Tanacetum coccineum]
MPHITSAIGGGDGDGDEGLVVVMVVAMAMGFGGGEGDEVNTARHKDWYAQCSVCTCQEKINTLKERQRCLKNKVIDEWYLWVFVPQKNTRYLVSRVTNDVKYLQLLTREDNKRNVVKARSLINMLFPMYIKLTFSNTVMLKTNVCTIDETRFGGNEATKKTQKTLLKQQYENFSTSSTQLPSARFQSSTDGSKPKPRSNNQTPRSLPVSKSSCVTITAVPKADHSKSSSSFSDSKHFVCSTCHKCVFNANHDACITKLLKEVNSHAKIQSHKTRNSNKPVDQKSHTQKPGRQIFTRHRFSPNKTSVVYEKTSPRSDLRWKPTGRIFKSVGLRWIPTGKLFDSCTSKDDSEPTHGSNVDIPNIHESKQTLDLSAGTSINVQKEQSLDLSAELESLFGPLFDEYFNGENQVVSKSSAVTTADASDKRQQQPDSTSSTSTLATTVTADGNFDL